jgi:predicted extracellular nuclease
VPGHVCLTETGFEIGVFDPAAPDALDSPGSAGCGTDNGGGNGEPVAVKIHEIQGSGAEVAITDRVIIEGVVTTLFEDNDLVEGFFLQEEDADTDADPATSEGIFVFCNTLCPATLAANQLVSVTGTPSDFFGMSQITADDENNTVTIISETAAPVTPSAFTLPASGSTTDAASFEALEGMLVNYSGKLVISEYFQLGRFGQLVLSPDMRTQQFTSTNAPTPEGYSAFLEELAANRIILDDFDNDQNEVLGSPDEAYFYPQGGLSADNFFRGGDSIEGLTGVMHWSFAGSGGTDAWRIRPVPGVDYTFTPENPRTAEPAAVGGQLKVASFNVLNYFTTLDEAGNLCGPSLLDCRGAHSEAELERQRTKIVAALSAINADVIGLIEIENDATTALNSLATALSDATGKSYSFIDTGSIGTDAIKVGLLYNTASVSPEGDFALLDSSVDARFVDTRNRPMLAQSFRDSSSGATFTTVVGHLKSKGSACDDLGDPNANDGQGNCNLTRTLATQALVDWLATDPTNSGNTDALVIGDLNAYAMEDPITTMEAAGYQDLVETFVGADAYSFVFDGQLGYLDHALASPSLVSRITGVTIWPINADEVNLLDYNDAVQDPSEASFERKSSANELFAPNPARSSDHDPVIVGLTLKNPADVDSNGCVDRADRFTVFLGALVQRWFNRYTPALDLNNDGKVDIADVKIVRDNFSRKGGLSCHNG